VATAAVDIRKAQRQRLTIGDYRLRSAQEADCAELVAEPCIISDAGQIRIVYLHLAGLEDFGPLVQTLRAVRYDTTQRTSGMTSTSRVFGYEPRKVLRKDYCSVTSMLQDAPEAVLHLQAAAETVERYYRETNPVLYARHDEMARNKVRQEWRLSRLFTSGIVNFNNPLPYHYDAGNFADVWSAMLVFKGAGVEGGQLAVPEYGLRFALPDHSLFMFDGQGLLHGVTPIVKTQPDSYRLSTVFYSLRAMWACLPPGQELARIRKVKTERERRRGGLR
jgi:2-oxoglutarate-Fe(II)-dependent dioxygenase family protein